MSDLTVAKTIAAQLGQALRLLGAINLVGSDNSLSFKIRGSKKYTHIRITLEPDDTYTIHFARIRKFEVRDEETVSDVYCDQLHDIIQDKTGLYTTFHVRATEGRAL